MKKNIFIICTIALVFLAYSYMSEPSEAEKATWTTYVINDKTCRMVYSCSAEEAAEDFATFKEIDGHVRETSLDEEGNFVLTLSEDDIAHWKKEMEENFARIIKAAKDSDCSLEIGDDYHSITSTIPQEYALGAGMDVLPAQLWCATMQMLNGEDPNEWWVDVTFIDIESGNVVMECKDFPRTSDGFEIDPEDWERARKQTTEQSAS